ncbi:MAG: hypothetical protein EXQ96_09520 [Alphaproteobacteria bacterium]|nr:hypothetical protein [Alphaproteobacteria bacterium]
MINTDELRRQALRVKDILPLMEQYQTALKDRNLRQNSNGQLFRLRQRVSEECVVVAAVASSAYIQAVKRDGRAPGGGKPDVRYHSGLETAALELKSALDQYVRIENTLTAPVAPNEAGEGRSGNQRLPAAE